jgi:uncharacterized membrane protein YGL010W
MADIGPYMEKYEHEHHNGWNKLLHAIGIPVIFLSLALFVMGMWRGGLAAFVGGWAMLFLGHKIEGNNPAFFQGPIYFLVGPLWVAKEIKEHLFGAGKRASPEQTK